MLAEMLSDPTYVALVMIVGYLLGSIPFGLIVTRLAGLGDIRDIGSGSIGATKVLRTGNKSEALLTLILDGGKGALAAVAAGYLAPELAPIAAVFVVLGHLYPVWLGFNGGKGFAAALGALAVLSLPIALGVGLTWLIVAAIFRFSSLSTLISIALAPLYAWIGNEQRIAIAPLIIAAFLWARHRQNIQRLRTAKEPKIGKKAFRPAASG